MAQTNLVREFTLKEACVTVLSAVADDAKIYQAYIVSRAIRVI